MTRRLPFRKMHGLGNDFVVIDLRRTDLHQGDFALMPDHVCRVADRRLGVGCDQVVFLQSPRDPEATLFMRIVNPDGSEAGTCGNATRCVASLILGDGGDAKTIETASGLRRVWWGASDRTLVAADMGAAQIDWTEIPLAQEADTLRLAVGEGPLQEPTAVSMGNPHAVFFVADVNAIDLETLGPILERHPLFPERTNVEVVAVHDRSRLRMRVWERGAGITPACGSGACAALVAASRRGLSERAADVVLDGGVLRVEWRESDGHVIMTGPYASSFTGILDEALLA